MSPLPASLSPAQRIAILATGSRGDVQPFVALAYGLQQAGRSVYLVTNSHFEPWAQTYGLAVRPIQWDAQASLQSERGQQMVHSGGLLAGIRYALQEAPRIFARVQGECRQACQDAEVLVYSLLSPWGQAIAEQAAIPSCPGLLHPMIPTGEFPTQLMPGNWGRVLNRLSHRLGEWGFWLLIRQATNTFRSQLGLPPIRFPHTVFDLIRQQQSPLLCSLSPAVLPPPADWPATVHMHGYWFLPPPPAWQPSSALLSFIRRGPPPVYVGFGSMANQGAAAMTGIVVDALHQAGQRGILTYGWGGLESNTILGEDLFVLDEAPHEWLFPQMAAVVHHGGAGTTAAGFRAGIPQVIVPHMQDQPYWGGKVQALGCGPQPLPRSRLSASALAQAIHSTVNNPALRGNASALGEKVRAEEGVGWAVSFLERGAFA